MDTDKFANDTVKALSLEPARPYSTLASALVNRSGQRAYLNNAGELILPNGRDRRVYEDFASSDTADQVMVCSPAGAAGGARVVTTNVLNHVYTPGGNILAAWNIVQQDLPPVIVAGGLDIGCDQTASDGMEILTNFNGASGRPFVVGSDPGFYFKCVLTIADASGLNPLFVGFRKAEAANVTLASYTDYAGIGFNTSAATGAIKLLGENDGSAHANYPIDTTDTWADGATKELGIFVSASGLVSYTINGIAPTATGAAQFDDGDVVVPIIHFLQAASSPTAVVIGSWDVGLQ